MQKCCEIRDPCKVWFIKIRIIHKMKLWISPDEIFVPAPSIPHFKGLGIRNLQYESRICQKSHNTVTITGGSNFYESDFTYCKKVVEYQKVFLIWLTLVSFLEDGTNLKKPSEIYILNFEIHSIEGFFLGSLWIVKNLIAQFKKLDLHIHKF